MAQQSPDLGWRERQIVDVLYRIGEASVADVRKSIPEPSSYSAVRAILNSLVSKGVATYRQEKKRYLYRAVEAKSRVQKSALRSLVRNFFGGEPAQAVAALLEGSAGRMGDDDLQRLRKLIDDARKEP